MRGISDINWIYKKYYSGHPALKKVVITHSEMVAKKALAIKNALNLPLDSKDIYIAAMLHDIGVVKCNAPGIGAFGEVPYLQHGLEGEKILLENGLEKYANICKTHTGSGITAKEITDNNLPLPSQDMLPVTLLEKLICYADKFYSKSGDITREKSVEEISSQMKKFGEDSYTRFMEMHRLFSSPESA